MYTEQEIGRMTHFIKQIILLPLFSFDNPPETEKSIINFFIQNREGCIKKLISPDYFPSLSREAVTDLFTATLTREIVNKSLERLRKLFYHQFDFTYLHKTGTKIPDITKVQDKLFQTSVPLLKLKSTRTILAPIFNCINNKLLDKYLAELLKIQHPLIKDLFYGFHTELTAAEMTNAANTALFFKIFTSGTEELGKELHYFPSSLLSAGRQNPPDTALGKIIKIGETLGKFYSDTIETDHGAEPFEKSFFFLELCTCQKNGLDLDCLRIFYQIASLNQW